MKLEKKIDKIFNEHDTTVGFGSESLDMANKYSFCRYDVLKAIALHKAEKKAKKMQQVFGTKIVGEISGHEIFISRNPSPIEIALKAIRQATDTINGIKDLSSAIKRSKERDEAIKTCNDRIENAIKGIKSKKDQEHTKRLCKITTRYPYPFSIVEKTYNRVKNYQAVETILKHSMRLGREPSHIIDMIFDYNESYK